MQGGVVVKLLCKFALFEYSTVQVFLSFVFQSQHRYMASVWYPDSIDAVYIVYGLRRCCQSNTQQLLNLKKEDICIYCSLYCKYFHCVNNKEFLKVFS